MVKIWLDALLGGIKMIRKIYANTDYGVHALMSVVSTLRRKEFDIVGVSMDYVDDRKAELCITLREHAKLNAEYAKFQLEKIIDIQNIMIGGGEQ